MDKTKLLSVSFVAGLCLATAFCRIASAQPAPDTTGPYKIVMEMDPSLPDHTVYRPVVAFGNGACADVGNAFQNYLAEVASHGFVVVANGPIDPDISSHMPKPGTPMPPMPPQAGKEGGNAGQPPRFPTFKQSKTSELFETMDWAKNQNEAKGNPYYGKLDPTSIAVMGQSCGGLQALVAAEDPRVKTAVILNSGIIRNLAAMPGGPPPGPGAPAGAAPPPGPAMPPVSQMVLPGNVDTLKKLHTPVIYIIGGPTDIAYQNAESDFADINNGLPLFNANLKDAGHMGTFWQPHGGKFAETATQWLLWQLKGDQKAKTVFAGEDCGLCRQAEWKVQRKNM
jgi:hypothetical protein